MAYVERFISKFVKTKGVVDLSSRKDSYDFVRGLTEKDDNIIGSGSYSRVYSCNLPPINPLDFPAGTHGVKVLTDFGARTYEWEKLILTKFQYDFAPRLFGYSDNGAMKYFIMEYLSGGTLTKKIGELEYGEALAIMIDVCKGVHAIHTDSSDGRFLHDDLSPRNIVFTEINFWVHGRLLELQHNHVTYSVLGFL